MGPVCSQQWEWQIFLSNERITCRVAPREGPGLDDDDDGDGDDDACMMMMVVMMAMMMTTTMMMMDDDDDGGPLRCSGFASSHWSW